MNTISVDELQRLARSELSPLRRLGHVALLLVAAGMTVVITSLWLTEPALVPRAQIAFGVMTMIGIAWSAFAIWVLSARRPLFAYDSVVAGRMAVAFNGTFLAGALLIGVTSGGRAPFAAAAMGAVMLICAFIVLARARRKRAALVARRDALVRELGG